MTTMNIPFKAMPKKDGKTLSEDRKARVMLPVVESDALAHELAGHVNVLQSKRDEKKDYDNAANREIKRLEGVAKETALRVEEGDETLVPHIVQVDETNNQVRVYRTDIDPPVCVEVRPIEESDLQTELSTEGGEGGGGDDDPGPDDTPRDNEAQ
jgi:hypothetical protein